MSLAISIRARFRAWKDGGHYKFLIGPAHALWRAWGHARGIALRPSVIRELRAVPPVDSDAGYARIADLIRGGGFHSLVYSYQVPSELVSLLRDVKQLAPKRILEVGTHRGGTLFALTRVADPAALVVSLDLPGGMWGGGYPWWKCRLYKALGLPGQRVELIRADSHAPASLEQVRQLLGGEPLDLLFIDGDHTYDGVKRDFEMYGPLVRTGGLIGFHDVAWHPRNEGGDVPRFWEELKVGRHVTEYVETPGGGFGIGVIHV